MKQFYDCITDFIFVQNAPEPADLIFVPGGAYPEAAQHAAELYRKGYAPYVLPSGRYSITVGHFVMPEAGQQKADAERKSDVGAGKADAEEEGTKKDRRGASDTLPKTEFEYLRRILLAAGVPEAAVLREDRATYTYQNAIYSRETVERAGLLVRRAILCCQAFHARRCLMYYQEQFPETEFLVCPVVTRGISRENWMQTEQGIDTVLGEVERCGGQFHEILRSYL